MKFSEHWLRTFADPPLESGALADVLTFGGIEVEQRDPAAPPFSGVVVGKMLSVEKHPQADRLSVCRVDTGDGERTIVCGAPNVRADIKVPVAMPGAALPGIQVSIATMRGVESQGMLCSARELGVSEDATGLLILPPDAAVGSDVRKLLDLDDHVFTTKPTPNRGDCLSLLGMAREVAALTGVTIHAPAASRVSEGSARRLAVEILEPAACPRYCGRVVAQVNAAAHSPLWMQQRLERSGVRSISAIVDITNYVMLELGQPLHAFDASRLSGGVRVRYPRRGERLALLNGETLDLAADMLVIADEDKPVALAGIMGGSETAVVDATTDIFLESAYFDPDVIAGKSRRLGFGSDSSFRFERGVDFDGTRRALDRATQLVLEICGGAAGPVTEASGQLPERKPVALRTARAARLLGVDIGARDIREVLARLGFEHREEGDRFFVTPPSYRFDIAIETDLVEEVARIHGYGNIPVRMPRTVAAMLPASAAIRSPSAVRRSLAGRDYHEVVTYSFVDRQWEEHFAGNREPIALANPIASQMSVMRSSLLGGLVDAVRFNARHKQPRVRLFEIGRCFLSRGSQYEQPVRVAAIAYGEASREQWASGARQVDFFDVKADLQALFAPRQLILEAADHPAFHPGKCAIVRCAGETSGWIGELHPRWQQTYDLPLAPVLFEIDYNALAAGANDKYNEISKYPPVRRDLAAIFDEQVSYQTVLDGLNRQKSPIVADIRLFDVYRGADLGKGKKSLAFRVLLQDTRKTLTDAEVESAVLQLRSVLQQQFNAKLR